MPGSRTWRISGTPPRGAIRHTPARCNCDSVASASSAKSIACVARGLIISSRHESRDARQPHVADSGPRLAEPVAILCPLQLLIRGQRGSAKSIACVARRADHFVPVTSPVMPGSRT